MFVEPLASRAFGRFSVRQDGDEAEETRTDTWAVSRDGRWIISILSC